MQRRCHSDPKKTTKDIELKSVSEFLTTSLDTTSESSTPRSKGASRFGLFNNPAQPNTSNATVAISSPTASHGITSQTTSTTPSNPSSAQRPPLPAPSRLQRLFSSSDVLNIQKATWQPSAPDATPMFRIAIMGHIALLHALLREQLGIAIDEQAFTRKPFNVTLNYSGQLIPISLHYDISDTVIKNRSRSEPSLRDALAPYDLFMLIAIPIEKLDKQINRFKNAVPKDQLLVIETTKSELPEMEQQNYSNVNQRIADRLALFLINQYKMQQKSTVPSIAASSQTL